MYFSLWKRETASRTEGCQKRQNAERITRNVERGMQNAKCKMQNANKKKIIN